jgi:hypothetical protein
MVLAPVVHRFFTTPRQIEMIEHTFRYMEKNEGREPPRVVERRMQKVPKIVKRDTRYNVLNEELIFVCGVGGGLRRCLMGISRVRRRRGGR